MKKDIILTFDYELFLGKDSGNLEECLLTITDDILNVFAKNDGVGLFFIDSSYLVHIKKYSHEEYKVYCDLIRKIVRNGHDIGLHIHPHWLDAVRKENGNWDLSNYSQYRLHNLPPAKLNAYFNECLELLKEVISLENEKYQIKSFRAGGWSITPFNELKRAFAGNGIDMDFSVLPGDYLDHRPVNFYDFRNANKKNWYWHFDNDPSQENPNGEFIEIPVTRYRIHPFLFLLNKHLHNKTRKKSFGGVSASHSSITEKIIKLVKSIKYASLDDIANQLIDVMMRRMGKRETICFVGHPKSFSNSTIQLLDDLLLNNRSLSIEMIRNKILEIERTNGN